MVCISLHGVGIYPVVMEERWLAMDGGSKILNLVMTWMEVMDKVGLSEVIIQKVG